MNHSELLNPTVSAQRIGMLDALRGFALFGILFVNMTWFTGFAVLSADQRAALGSAGIDAVAYWLINWLIDGKFWSMFAFLFGVGVAVQSSRAQARTVDFAPWLVRRLVSLVAIGLLHAVFLWFGDIVSLYAVAGFGLLLFFRMSDRRILCWAFALLLFPIVQSAVWLKVNPSFDTSHGPYEKLVYFGSGTYAEVFAANWLFLTKRWLLAVYSGRFFQLLGMFLIGYWAVRQRIFEQPDRHRSLLKSVLTCGLVLGLPTNALLATHPSLNPWLGSWLLTITRVIGVPALCLAYVAAFTLIYSHGLRGLDVPSTTDPEGPTRPRPTDKSDAINLPDEQGNRFLSLFAPAGRMTLTNYIMQSVIGIVIFYGCGFGYWGKIGMAWTVLLIFAIFCLQSLLSVWWLTYFRHGPFEWFWRCLTYGRWLPMWRE